MYTQTVDKIQHPLMVKTLNKIGREGNILSDELYLQPEQNTKHRTTAYIILSDFPLKLGTRQR